MSIIRDNLLKLYLARAVAETVIENSTDDNLCHLAKRLMYECDIASKALQWNSVKINLRTCSRLMEQYSKDAYGNPKLNEVDALRLIGVAITQLEDAAQAQGSLAKSGLFTICVNTLLEMNELIDQGMTEVTPYIEAASDARTLEDALS